MNNSKKEIQARANRNLIEANTKLVDKNKWLKKDNEILEERIFNAIERLQDYDLVEDTDKVINDVFEILRGDDK